MQERHKPNKHSITFIEDYRSSCIVPLSRHTVKQSFCLWICLYFVRVILSYLLLVFDSLVNCPINGKAMFHIQTRLLYKERRRQCLEPWPLLHVLSTGEMWRSCCLYVVCLLGLMKPVCTDMCASERLPFASYICNLNVKHRRSMPLFELWDGGVSQLILSCHRSSAFRMRIFRMIVTCLLIFFKGLLREISSLCKGDFYWLRTVFSHSCLIF
jgi:hypothetical protein